jgi:hypothetical protein
MDLPNQEGWHIKQDLPSGIQIYARITYESNIRLYESACISKTNSSDCSDTCIAGMRKRLSTAGIETG